MKDLTEISLISTEKFNEAEVRKVIKTLENKSPGMDGISAEMLKGGDDIVVKWLCNLVYQVSESGTALQDWKNGIIVCIRK